MIHDYKSCPPSPSWRSFLRSAVSDLSRAVSDAAGGASFAFAPVIDCSDAAAAAEEGAEACRKKPPLPVSGIKVVMNKDLRNHEPFLMTTS